MEETNDVQALEKISTEVDESQMKVILSNQCIKAQSFLLDKLRRLAERHKETCNFISSANLKLEAEIKQADQEIQSALKAQQTIKLAIVEIKKELLLAKTKKVDVGKGIAENKKKYEDLWIQCKNRYESIPFVQKLLRAQDKVQALNNAIVGLDKDMVSLYEDMEKQKQKCIELDKKACIELAHFMITEKPKMIKYIEIQEERIKEFVNKIEELLKVPEQINVTEAVSSKEPVSTAADVKSEVKGQPMVSKNEDDLLIPKLNLQQMDLNIMDINFHEVKIKKDALLTSISTNTDFMENYLGKSQIQYDRKHENTYDYLVSPYFKPMKEDNYNFAKRKLINILEDVHINANEAYKMVQQVNPEMLCSVNEISAEIGKKENTQETPKFAKDKQANTVIESEIIEEIDMTPAYTDNNILIPPTQFLDLALSNLQESLPKKRVAFELTPSPKINEIVEDDDKSPQKDCNDIPNQSIDSQIDTTAASDASFTNIKDMILKKHNLDLTPEFVYAKTAPKQREDGKVISSVFFQNDNNGENKKNTDIDMVQHVNVHKTNEDQANKDNEEELDKGNEDVLMDIDEVVLSPKPNKPIVPATLPENDKENCEKATSGLLFTHGTQAIPDSLNVSVSTTGFEEQDFPYCIDTSLLLSPKGEVPANNDDNKVVSQEVPNFLSGFRKTGLSFFGGSSTKQEDSTEQTGGNNFNFNFGGEKKSRGGLFSFFQ